MATPEIWKGGKLLLALADFLENDPRVKGHFDMDVVLDHATENWPALDKRGFLKVTCGTAACAMGWAPMVPALRRAGLRYHADYSGRAIDLELGGRECGFMDAAVDLFGIDPGEAAYLFNPAPSHRTPKQVARNIRRFVAERAKRGK